MKILDFLFPKYCVNCREIGSFLCDRCFTYLRFADIQRCGVCDRPAVGGITHPACRGKYTIDGIFASIAYSVVVKKLLYSFKYKPYVSALTPLLSDFLYEGLIQNESFSLVIRSDSLITAIPLFPLKLRQRGYNQAELLAKELAKKLNLSYVPLLARVLQTPSQVGLSKESRKENIKGVFAVHKNNSVLPKTVLLVDDVVTTGSTLSEAAKVLKKSGIQRVYGVALARD